MACNNFTESARAQHKSHFTTFAVALRLLREWVSGGFREIMDGYFREREKTRQLRGDDERTNDHLHHTKGGGLASCPGGEVSWGGVGAK